MRSTLIPAPELDLARVGHLRARARRGPDAPAGSPVTLPDPLTAMDICAKPVLHGHGLGAEWAKTSSTPVLQVPDGLLWCFYGIGDLSRHDHLAGLRLRVETPGKKGPSTRVAEDWEINLLHLGQQIAIPQDYRQPRLGYLEPPVWLHGGTRFWFEFLGTGFYPDEVAAIVVLGYSGTGLA